MEPSRFPLSSAVVLGGLIALGVALGGMFIGRGFLASRMERFVTVRGLVERPVRADVALWTVSFSATNDDVARANAQIERDRVLSIAFAKKQGFTDAEIEQAPTKVTDQTRYGGNEARASGRYRVDGGVRIRSSNVDRVQQASQLTGELIAQGVVLSFESDSGFANPSYYFTKLDEIRPSMLADATKSARAVAEQFAKDSGSKLGAIRRANQGVFQILPRDAVDGQGTFEEPKSIDKKVRLVSTIDYYLGD
jgi:hypothetical protein